jgi:hypothetical protein
VFSLAGLPDGTYTLRVTSTDSAGNVSATSVTTYVLDTQQPDAPHLDYSSPTPSTDDNPYWGFTLPDGTTGRCELLKNGVVLATRGNCKGAVSFDLSGRPAGTYTVRIYSVDDAGNVSKPLVLTYVRGTRSSGGSAPPPPSGNPGFGGGGVGGVNGVNGGGGHGRGKTPLPPAAVRQVLQQFGRVAQAVRGGAKKVVHDAGHALSAVIPAIHDKVTENVSAAVQGVVDAVSHVGGGTGFPLLLLLIVFAFLLMQNRIDRRDPKLALASVAADDTVEFLPPPSRGADR